MFILISCNHVNSEQLSSFCGDFNTMVQTRFCYQSPVCTPQVSLYISVCLPKREEPLLQWAWPALGFCDSVIHFLLDNSELCLSQHQVVRSYDCYLHFYSWLDKMLKLSQHVSMLLRKLCPIIDKLKDGLMGQWIEKHGNDAPYIFVSLTFK